MKKNLTLALQYVYHSLLIYVCIKYYMDSEVIHATSMKFQCKGKHQLNCFVILKTLKIKCTTNILCRIAKNHYEN